MRVLLLALCLSSGRSLPAWQADFGERPKEPAGVLDDEAAALQAEDDAIKERYRQLEDAAAQMFADEEEEGGAPRLEDELAKDVESYAEMYRNLTAQEERNGLYNPMYWIDRNILAYASAPVVEIGFWREVLYSFYRMKKTFVDNVMDFGGRPVSDRRVARRLRKVLEAGCEHLDKAVSGDNEADILARTKREDARTLAWAMLMALPARSYLVPQIDLRKETLEPKKATTNWYGNFIGEPRRQKAHFNTVDELGFPRQAHWGTLTYFEELGKALGLMDKVVPFSSGMLRLYKMIKPTPYTKQQVASPQPRQWKVASGFGSAYDSSIEVLAKCLAQHELPY